MATTADTRAEARVTFARQRRQLVEALTSAGLTDRISEFEPLIRDTIRLSVLPKSRKKASTGASRLGGLPDLPKGTAWPHAEGDPLSFVGQLDLRDTMPFDVHERLPNDGLMSIFAGHPLSSAGVPREHAEVIYIDKDASLEPTTPPEAPGWWVRRPPAARLVTFKPAARLPVQGNTPLRHDPRYRDFYSAYYGYDEGDAEPENGLLGFDRGESAVEGSEEILLRLDRGDIPYSYDWCEAETIYVLINADALAMADFSEVRFVEGGTL